MKKLLITFLAVMFVFACSKMEDKKDNTVMTDHSSHVMKGDGASLVIINLMHEPMMQTNFQKTKNPDIDYIVNMIPHHKGAVLSSEELLKVSTNEDAKMIASKIIADQNAEINEFNMVLKDLQAKNTDYTGLNFTNFANESEAIMNKMMTDMSNIPITNDVTIDYLYAMIPHHQGAIDASKKILTVTKDSKIKEIANRIVNAQEKEITEIKGLIKKITGK